MKQERKVIRYGSVCSGIEAATAAWHTLGWAPSFFSEIEAFPRAVLAHHYPNVPLHGDFTTIQESEYEPIDLLVGGTPCQSFSVAGLRGGLDDERGNLALEYIRLAQRLRPRWIVWENVPGVLSSNGGRDFGTFLGALEEIGYGWAYRVLDAQYFGVAQRRRRVFVVGYLGDWRPAAAVLFERESLRRDTAPRREKRQKTSDNVAKCLTARGAGAGNCDPETSNMIPVGVADLAPTILSSAAGYSRPGNAVTEHETYVPMAVDVYNQTIDGQTAATLTEACGGTNTSGPKVMQAMAVRRLTPVECERLQGFPDNYTNIKENCPDGPRYKALGNSMAVPVMRWIGDRIDKVCSVN